MTRSEFVDRVIAVVLECGDGQQQECAEALMGLGIGLFEDLGIEIDEILAAVRRNHKPLRAIGRLA